jgi:hypothetical protein
MKFCSGLPPQTLNIILGILALYSAANVILDILDSRNSEPIRFAALMLLLCSSQFITSPTHFALTKILKSSHIFSNSDGFLQAINFRN